MNKKPKIILFDIETSLGLFAAFGLYPDSIPHQNVIKDWSITCICWKELGKKTVHSAHTYDGNDKSVCIKFHKVLQEADVIIGHNSDKFDIKKLNARFMIHGLPPIDPPISIDTLKEIKKVASFTSHRLDYLGKVLCNDTKMSTSAGLWLKVLRGEKRAVQEMVRYCKQDVLLLEDLYLRIRKYMKGHPNIYGSSDKATCPKCGSHNLIKYGTKTLRSGIQYQRYRCADCGAIIRGKRVNTKIEYRNI